jgi:transcriptional regulator with XRE-family HTH domain
MCGFLLDGWLQACYYRCVQPVNPIISALAAHQTANGWSDERVAEQVGVSRQYWNFLRRGRRQPERETLIRIGTGFPHLQDAVASFLAPDWKKVARPQPQRTNAA